MDRPPLARLWCLKRAGRIRAARAASCVALALALAQAPLSLGCGGEPMQASAGTEVLADWSGKSGFFGAPFPSDARLSPDGTADLAAFPNPASNTFAARIIDLAGQTRGFGTTTAVYFALSGALNEADLPDPHQSLEDASPVLLVSVDELASDYKKRYPLTARFLADGGPYGAPNLLALLPLQGVPLLPETRYAAVVRRSLRDSKGAALAVSAGMQALLEGSAPAGMSAEAFESYTSAIAALSQAGVPSTDIAGLTVFTTGAPTAQYEHVAKAMLKETLPLPSVPFTAGEIFDDYCVYQTTIPMPVYQEGEPPYSDVGGGWVFDVSGEPVLQRMEEANFVVTIPRRPMPKSGYPMIVLSRTGAGGERPLVDRGVRAMPGGPAITPGTGPALVYAKAGFAGASIDGPHGGLRNITKGDEQFLVFNIGNPIALRDNLRQSAAELGLASHILAETVIDVSACPGATTTDGMAHFDSGKFAIMGHSMGASIIPLTFAFEPSYGAMVQSGAGSSFLENVVHKQKPIQTKPLAEILIGLGSTEYSLTEVDPLLNLLQWAGEAADVPPYAARILRAPDSAPRHVLTMQGIVDHYILPPIANPTALSIGLDLAGDALDEITPELDPFTPIGDLLDIGGRGRIGLPASGNVDVNGSKVTAVVVQHPEDGVEDGHEIVFQTEPPKHQIRCFLESFAAGSPKVPVGAKLDDPCE